MLETHQYIPPSLLKGRRSDWEKVCDVFTRPQGSVGSIAGILTLYTSQDEYWNLLNLSFGTPGQEMGYLRTIWVDQDRAKEIFKTPWHFKRKFGWCFDITNLKKTWIAAHLHAHRSPASSRKLGYLALSMETEVSDVEMAYDLQLLDEEMGYTKERDRFLKEREDFAFPEHTEVYRDFRRHGIATLLYTEAAKYLAGLGFPLYSSTLISDLAEATWRAMFASGRYPMRLSRHLCNKGQSRYVLDYRNV